MLQRFWPKINKTKTCWNWTAARCHFGYGRVGINRNGLKTTTKASRISWEFHNGNIPNGLCVLHKCDNPSCVRPSHLFLGSRLDNAIDRGNKGRTKTGYVPGSLCGTSKILEKDSIKMRELRKQGLSYPKIAARFDLSYAQTRRTILGINWKHTL